jgi:outer membrane protein
MRFYSFFVGCVFLLSSPSLSAQDMSKPVTSDDPRLDPTRIVLEGDPIDMGLADLVVIALDKNLDLQISAVDMSITKESRIAQEGIYDPLLESRVGYEKNEGELNQFGTNPSWTTKDGNAEYKQTDTTYSFSLSQLVPSGAVLSLGFDRNRRDYRDNRGALLPLTPEENQYAYVRVVQPLLKNFGPKVTNLGIKVAEKQELVARYLYRQDVEDQISEVMLAYWDLVFSIRNLEVQRTALEASLELERVNSIRVETGVSPRSDLYQAQADVAKRRNDVIISKARILAAQDQLIKLINWSLPTEEWSRPIIPQDQPDKYDLDLQFDNEEMIADAISYRYDLQATDLAIEVAKLTRDALWWQRFPELNAIGEFGYAGMSDSSSDAFDDIDDGDYENYFVGLEFRYPLFNRKAKAEYRRSKDRISQTELSSDSLELTIKIQVRQATRLIQAAQESIEASKAQVRAAQETLNSERKRLEVGSSTTFEVLSFQQDLTEAQVNEVQALVSYQKGLIDLQRSRGQLLEVIGENLGVQFAFDPVMDEDKK